MTTTKMTNVPAEEAALGALLLDPAMAGPHLRRCVPEDFTSPLRRAMLAAYLDSGAADLVALATAAANVAHVTVEEALAYATQLLQATTSFVDVGTHVDLVIAEAEKRRGLDIISKAGASLVQGQDWGEVSLWLQDQIRERRGAAESSDLKAVVDVLFDRVTEWSEHPLAQGEVRHLSTGLRDLDRLTGGLQAGLYLSGARPSIGKTALWSQVAERVGHALRLRNDDREALYFTNEMSDQQLAMRLACAMAQVSTQRVEQGRMTLDEHDRFYQALDRLQSDRLRLVYARSLPAIVSQCYQSKPALVVVDYLNKLSGGQGENRNQQYGHIAGTLFDMANDLQVPVVLLCQLNRDLAKRGKDALPEMEDLRDSGELEQIADVILLLHRTEEDPYELVVLKRKDRLSGGQHNGTRLYFGPHAEIGDAAVDIPAPAMAEV